jgi:hypothetical protein
MTRLTLLDDILALCNVSNHKKEKPHTGETPKTTGAVLREGKSANTAFEASMHQILNPLPAKKKGSG